MAKKQREKKVIPPTETKAERFKRVVSPRVARALKAISLIGTCTGSAYEYSPEVKKQIFDALMGAVADLQIKYDGKEKPQTDFVIK